MGKPFINLFELRILFMYDQLVDSFPQSLLLHKLTSSTEKGADLRIAGHIC